MKTGTAYLPLHHGTASPWQLLRMVRLARPVARGALEEGRLGVDSGPPALGGEGRALRRAREEGRALAAPHPSRMMGARRAPVGADRTCRDSA